MPQGFFRDNLALLLLLLLFTNQNTIHHVKLKIHTSLDRISTDDLLDSSGLLRGVKYSASLHSSAPPVGESSPSFSPASDCCNLRNSFTDIGRVIWTAPVPSVSATAELEAGSGWTEVSVAAPATPLTMVFRAYAAFGLPLTRSISRMICSMKSLTWSWVKNSPCN